MTFSFSKATPLYWFFYSVFGLPPQRGFKSSFQSLLSVYTRESGHSVSATDCPLNPLVYWLLCHFVQIHHLFWSEWLDLNQRPLPPQGGFLLFRDYHTLSQILIWQQILNLACCKLFYLFIPFNKNNAQIMPKNKWWNIIILLIYQFIYWRILI